jgi:hypothetical protein
MDSSPTITSEGEYMQVIGKKEMLMKRGESNISEAELDELEALLAKTAEKFEAGFYKLEYVRRRRSGLSSTFINTSILTHRVLISHK